MDEWSGHTIRWTVYTWCCTRGELWMSGVDTQSGGQCTGGAALEVNCG